MQRFKWMLSDIMDLTTTIKFNDFVIFIDELKKEDNSMYTDKQKKIAKRLIKLDYILDECKEDIKDKRKKISGLNEDLKHTDDIEKYIDDLENVTKAEKKHNDIKDKKLYITYLMFKNMAEFLKEFLPDKPIDSN